VPNEPFFAFIQPAPSVYGGGKDIIMSQIPHTNMTRLVVKNYRSLADIDIRLSPLTVFVGKNAVGKSNVIDVLRFVRDVLVNGFEQATSKIISFQQVL
jgi:predicted ATPase